MRTPRPPTNDRGCVRTTEGRQYGQIINAELRYLAELQSVGYTENA